MVVHQSFPIGGSLAFDRIHDDADRLIFYTLYFLDCFIDRFLIGTVAAYGVKAKSAHLFRNIKLADNIFRPAVELALVFVDENNDLIQFVRGDKLESFPALTFVQLTVAGNQIDFLAGVLQTQGITQTSRQRRALAEGTGGGVHSGRLGFIGVGRKFGAAFVQSKQHIFVKIALFGQRRVKGGAGVSLGQYQIIPVFPVRIFCVVAQVTVVQDGKKLNDGPVSYTHLLLQHVENLTKVYKLPCVVAINAFPTDTKAELDLVEKKCKELGVNVALSEVWAKGGEGGVALAEEVVRLVEEPNEFSFSYDLDLTIEEKLDAIVKRVYHGDGVQLTANAKKQAEQLTKLGFDKCPICVAKTQYSFSDDASLKGAPKGFTVTVRNLKISAGAGFIVALTGDIMTMPGLPKAPAAEKIDVDENGKISGLF